MSNVTVPEPGVARPYRFPPFEQSSVPGGAGVLTAQLDKLPLVSVTIILRGVGSAFEPQGKDGIAQLTAAMLLEGTTSRDGAALTEEFETLGGALTIAADWDALMASFTVHRDRLSQAFDLAAEVLRAPAFREADLLRLKAEHEVSRLQLMSDARGLADAAFAYSCFGGATRYARPIDGTRTGMAGVTGADVREFWNTCRSAALLSVVAAGDVRHATIEHLTAQLTREISHAPAIATARSEPLALESVQRVTLVAKDDASQAELRLGHVGVPRLHPDYFPLTVMNAVLGGLFSSRINLNLRERHGYTYGAFSGFDWRVDAGPWAVSTAVKSEVTSAAIREVIGEIHRMQAAIIDASELELATDYLVGVFPLRFETTAAVNAALASLVVFGLPADYYAEYRPRMREVSRESVLAAARHHLRPAALHVVAVGAPAVLRPQLEEIAGGAVVVRSPEEVEAGT